MELNELSEMVAVALKGIIDKSGSSNLENVINYIYQAEKIDFLQILDAVFTTNTELVADYLSKRDYIDGHNIDENVKRSMALEWLQNVSNTSDVIELLEDSGKFEDVQSRCLKDAEDDIVDDWFRNADASDIVSKTDSYMMKDLAIAAVEEL